MGMDWAGLGCLLAFYAVILLWGILAVYWYKRRVLRNVEDSPETQLVAGRQLGGVVGTLTLTATLIGGGWINGTAEALVTPGMGLHWTLTPLVSIFGFTLAGVYFAPIMKRRNYLTMFDPFQEKYGPPAVLCLYCGVILGDTFWSASILASLGTSLSVIINMDFLAALIVSAVVAVGYTMFGQLISVAYTDIVQICFMIGGLVLSVCFIYTNPAVAPVSSTMSSWVGTIPPSYTGLWLDLVLSLSFGLVPWQEYFQRVLALKQSSHVVLMSVVAGFGGAVLSIPSILIGMAAMSADWNQTDVPYDPLADDKLRLILPVSLKYLTPRAVYLIGLGAVSAAVMSSVDSAILSSASLFTHNLYHNIFRTEASQRELAWVQRAAVLVVGIIATVLAATVNSVYGILLLSTDLVFVILFPQLVCVLFIPFANTYGSVSGFCVAVVLRLLSGEPYLGLKAVIKYPLYDEISGTQLFPFRMLIGVLVFLTILGVSGLAWYVFERAGMPKVYDFLHSFDGTLDRSRYRVKQREEEEKEEEKDDGVVMAVRFRRLVDE